MNDLTPYGQREKLLYFMILMWDATCVQTKYLGGAYENWQEAYLLMSVIKKKLILNDQFNGQLIEWDCVAGGMN